MLSDSHNGDCPSPRLLVAAPFHWHCRYWYLIRYSILLENDNHLQLQLSVRRCVVGVAFLHEQLLTTCLSIHQYPSPTIHPSLPSDLYMDVAAESFIAWQPHPPSSPVTTALMLTVVQWEYEQQLWHLAVQNIHCYHHVIQSIKCAVQPTKYDHEICVLLMSLYIHISFS